jgi:4-oxalocrotonate tautomerase
MPILNLKMSGLENPDLTQAIVNKLTEITAKELNKEPEVTVVTVTYISEKNWFVNRNNLENQNLKSFYLDIKITDSTNLKQEKESYIKAVFELMEESLKNLHNESYIYVEEVKADSYGYGGKTQEYRYIKPKL